MSKYHLALSWYGATVTTFTFALILLIQLSFPRLAETPFHSGYKSYRALPESFSIVQESKIEKSDARALIIKNFFQGYKAPLAENADKFIEVADKYELDYRLLPAIAMQESNGGKKIPKNSYNPFGYGIYGSKVLRFESFDAAIETVGKGLKNNYIDQGLKNPWDIMAKYTPPALEKGGSWAIGVTAFMDQLQ